MPYSKTISSAEYIGRTRIAQVSCALQTDAMKQLTNRPSYLPALPNLACRAVIIIAILLFAASAPAQENRTVDGEELGTSNWQAITPGDSEFRGSRSANAFAILRNELPDRTQESWRHPGNRPRGPLLTMFYERLHDNFFAADLFDADFRSVFDLAFAAHGVSLDDARILALDDKAKAAFVSYGTTTCIFVMHIFGPIDNALSIGDRNARLFVCQRGDGDEELLGALALSMLSVLMQDGQGIGVSSPSTPALTVLIDRLFTREESI